jgi:hypothetical protein
MLAPKSRFIILKSASILSKVSALQSNSMGYENPRKPYVMDCGHHHCSRDSIPCGSWKSSKVAVPKGKQCTELLCDLSGWVASAAAIADSARRIADADNISADYILQGLKNSNVPHDSPNGGRHCLLILCQHHPGTSAPAQTVLLSAFPHMFFARFLPCR